MTHALNESPKSRNRWGTPRGDEQEVSRPERHRLVSHPEPAFAFEDHVTLVPVVGLLGVGADRGVEPHFKLAAVQGKRSSGRRGVGRRIPPGKASGIRVFALGETTQRLSGGDGAIPTACRARLRSPAVRRWRAHLRRRRGDAESGKRGDKGGRDLCLLSLLLRPTTQPRITATQYTERISAGRRRSSLDVFSTVWLLVARREKPQRISD